MKNRNEFIDILLLQLDRWSLRLLRISFILLFLIGAYITYDMWYVYNQASKDALSIFKPDEITDDSLAEISKDAIGWISIDNTNIDYPLMQGKDNTEYLNKGPDGKYRVSGSIFLDTRNKKDFTDAYNIIYGHHMTNGYMFGSLDSFKEKDFFYSHRTGTLSIPGKTFKIKVIGYILTDASADEVFDTDFPDENLRYEKIKAQAMHWEDSEGKGNIMALTTCKEPLTTTRTALLCRIY